MLAEYICGTLRSGCTEQITRLGLYRRREAGCTGRTIVPHTLPQLDAVLEAKVLKVRLLEMMNDGCEEIHKELHIQTRNQGLIKQTRDELDQSSQ